MGVSPRWHGQVAADVAHVRIAIDSDLIDLAAISEKLRSEGLMPSEMSVAQQVAWLYLSQGLEFVEQLRGAFSIALWDEKLKRLLLLVDHMGLKTMYWAREAEGLVFGSRPSAVSAALSKRSEVNPEAIIQYLLFSVVPSPLSAYRGIERLLPGRLLIFENGQVRQTQFWDATYEESEGHSTRYWAERVRESIRGAVHSQLESCEPDSTGAYLSGGTDSSSVVAFMSERFKSVNSFSIAFAEGRYNEIDFARTTANTFRTRHYEKVLAPEHAEEAISLITHYYDEPFANSSSIGSYFCARMARESGVTTLLAGDGGDELFGGNERYASDKRFAIYKRIPSWIRKGLLEPAAGLLPGGEGALSLPRRYIRRASIPNPRRIFSYGLFLSINPTEVFDQDFLAQVPPDHWLDLIENHFQSAHATSELNRLLYLDLKLILADNDVRKVSGTAELAGVQVRYPLMDYKLVEVAGQIPTNLKIRGFEKRYIFKQAMREILPTRVLYKTKHGFGVPLALWLLESPRLKSMSQDMLADTQTRQRGYFRPEFIDRLMKLHREGHLAYYGEILWHLVALELWHRQHLEKEVGFVGNAAN
jgi:asparagine synthase (glutamine-hydrolysing)